MISIHALRVEGDIAENMYRYSKLLFLSTPSGWRATRVESALSTLFWISIHALRVEGDAADAGAAAGARDFYPRPPGGGRLAFWRVADTCVGNFYPRPPGGGRPVSLAPV